MYTPWSLRTRKIWLHNDVKTRDATSIWTLYIVPPQKSLYQSHFWVTTIRFSSITSWYIFPLITIKRFAIKQSFDKNISSENSLNFRLKIRSGDKGSFTRLSWVKHFFFKVSMVRKNPTCDFPNSIIQILVTI